MLVENVIQASSRFKQNKLREFKPYDVVYLINYRQAMVVTSVKDNFVYVSWNDAKGVGHCDMFTKACLTLEPPSDTLI